MLATALWNEQSQDDDQRFLDAIANRALAPLALKGESSDWQGRLVGGNLTVLASLMGTPWQLKLNEGDILFLEDIAEPPYKLFRSLYQLSHSPNFASCQIILGHFTNCARPPQSIQALMHDLMKPYSNSWNYGCPAGHEAPNACIWLGKKASITQNQLICIA
jgi:muramoyltetrapeptide carboxypeptidase